MSKVLTANLRTDLKLRKGPKIPGPNFYLLYLTLLLPHPQFEEFESSSPVTNMFPSESATLFLLLQPQFPLLLLSLSLSLHLILLPFILARTTPLLLIIVSVSSSSLLFPQLEFQLQLQLQQLQLFLREFLLRRLLR